MNSNFHFGDVVNQPYGHHNIGIVKNQGATDPRAAFQEMLEAVRVLRDRVPAAERRDIEESLRTVEQAGQADPSALRRALGRIAGIATVVGEIGAPVVESVRKVLTALNL